MDPHLIVAYKLARLVPRPTEALFHTQLSEPELRRIFAPWLWLRVSKARDAGDVGCLALTPVAQIEVDSEFGSDPLDRDFFQEIAHHDFEIGGKNEWDGAPTRYGPFILRLLSRTHCRSFFPDVRPRLVELQRHLSRTVEALDIGCGPLSWLRWGMLEGILRVTGVDPLIEIYEIILSRHGFMSLPGVMPAVRVAATAESICGRPEFSEGYDFVFTNNALDHVQDIGQAIEAVRWALAPHGFAYLQVATREGTRQNWGQLHQHDLYLEGGHLVAARRDGSIVKLCGPSCPLQVVDVLKYDSEALTILASKG